MENINAEDWFSILKMPKKLSESEKMWLKTGFESQFLYKYKDYERLKNNIEDYFLITFGDSPKNIYARSRKRKLVEKRQMIHHCLKSNTKASLHKIGKDCGGLNHASVIHSIKNVDNLIEVDETFRIQYNDMLKSVGVKNII